MGGVEEDLREQLTAAFGSASFPVADRIELVPALPRGPSTRFEAGEFSMTAMEIAMVLQDAGDFPYEDVESLVDDVIEGLADEGYL